ARANASSRPKPRITGFASMSPTPTKTLAGVHGAGFRTTLDPEPHAGRRRSILAAHPELKRLFGHDARTAWVSRGLVMTQVALAFFIGLVESVASSWWRLV